MKKAMIGVLAVIALALGTACEQRPGSAERGGTTSAPGSRGPGGDTSSRLGSSASERAPGGMASGSATSLSPSDLSGTGGAGDAGMGGRDAGMR